MRHFVLLLLIGCASEAPPAGEPACNACHGSDTSIAPPSALGGSTDRQSRGVGAHQIHASNGLGIPVACDACHIMPASLNAPGHIDTPWPAEVVFDEVGSTGLTPVWDTDLLTCTTYCHGATLAGGASTEPSWVVPGGQSGCSTCHGAPPPLPHPQDGACGSCHETSRNGPPDPATHIDGILQVDPAQGCDACHGQDGDPAPPPALDGATDPSDPGVGAHTVHLDGTGVGPAIACATCHPVPTDVNDVPHLSGTTDVVMSGPAAAGGVTPAYEPSTQTCTVYCHGVTFAGATAPTPAWTDDQGGACSRCHAFPPAAPHPSSTACADCHPSGPGAIDAATHLDGTVDTTVVLGCDGCHGANGDPAPPPALDGATDPSDPGVGAHTVHL
ncbi:MAG: hypothetical protein KC656_16145, partial [Myxococcales bacterium]|nr:hypothetical protein [Myxococcales bacterium]